MYYNILVFLAYCIPSHLISDQSGHLVPDWFRESVLHVNHMFVNATDVNGDVGGREQRGRSLLGGVVWFIYLQILLTADLMKKTYQSKLKTALELEVKLLIVH